MRLLAMRVMVAAALLLVSAQALGRPYRLINARSPRSTGGGNLELGVRYQGFFVGDGIALPTLGQRLQPASFNQIGGSIRWGIIEQLELGFEASAIFFHEPGSDNLDAAPGDLVASLQGRLLKTQHHLLGLYTGFTIPTGPSDIDILPPFWTDGTFDIEALLLYELAWLPFRLVVDAGYVYHGTRNPAGDGRPFDVPDAFRWDVAAALNLGSRFLVCLELNGQHYFRPDLTPFWVDNQHLLEVTPGVRIEIVPRLVLEVGTGFGLTRATREIFLIRVQGGLTYEFNMY